MLKKILNIKNVGLFNNASWTSHTFEQTTLIYAENGRGKSTLASVLSSCAKGDAESINIRRSLGSTDALTIALLFDENKRIAFSENTWSDVYSDILVFDANFIDRNVYSGTTIDTRHRQELLEFALGEYAVQLKQKMDDETRKASEKGREITEFEKSLKILARKMSLDEFNNLKSELDVDLNTNLCQIRLNNATNNSALQRKEIPEIIKLKEFNIEQFFMILAKTLDCLENNAEKSVQKHCNNYPEVEFENWLSQGQLFKNDLDCPYCGQNITGNSLIKSYRDYFNKSYKELQSEALDLSQVVEMKFSKNIVDNLISIIGKNNLIIDGWNDHISLQKNDLNCDKLQKIFNQFYGLLSKLSISKQQNLLEHVGSQQDKEQSETLWGDLFLMVDNYNKSIKSLIADIQTFKNTLNCEDVSRIKKELEIFQITKIRYETDTRDLIQQWIEAKKSKELHEQNKSSFRTQLDSCMTQTLQQYQTKINELVRKLGGSFEIDALVSDYRGAGTPRSNYGLKVYGQEVSLSANNAPSFSTALSEGDKRTLAFAFFIARIESDPNLENKIIVFDDPVCSLDSNRRNQTKSILRTIKKISKQLIVLAHDKYFLRDLRDDIKDAKVLKIKRVENNYSNFDTCDIDYECASSYYRNHKILQDFVNAANTSDLDKVVKAIRPLLEGYLYRRFPLHIQRNQMFGNAIGAVREAQLPNPLAHLHSLVEELNEINNYAGQFHHDTSSDISQAELHTYAERTLTVIHKGNA
jgi:wobble nucleotide-excising tRNase